MQDEILKLTEVATEWHFGNQEKRQWAQIQSTSNLQADMVTSLDPILIAAILGKHSMRTSGKRPPPLAIANPQRLSADQSETLRALFQGACESSKPMYRLEDYQSAMVDCAQRMSSHLQDWEMISGKEEPLARQTLIWLLNAYGVLVQPWSGVTIGIRSIGGHKQFGLVANRDLVANQYLQELLGMVPCDIGTIPFTDLSVITPHPYTLETFQPGERRPYFGPMRFANHHCTRDNAMWCAVQDTWAFVLYITKDIKKGEEILVNYGEDYWEGELPLENTNQQTRGEDGKREKKRLRQKDRRANKKAILAVERASRTT
ncbi:hypothetical protein PC9H_008973 [Pleurotus ostreatus]|uniref:SET domain-containing protein n=1 Tax=Pleurotus ostreatus TaxID=5322 RepID=A0A8H6ZSB8_PLEOS|nr:uncharacterized protein PC9H_008973 [Pleurotus ostreatus]KAF7426604.1 hypothetical protein PC9H_008973 [Pleurotus ostreatus]